MHTPLQKQRQHWAAASMAKEEKTTKSVRPPGPAPLHSAPVMAAAYHAIVFATTG